MTLTATQQPGVVSLRDPRAHDSALTGAKAAALARARAHGIPVLDGFVLTTAWPDLGKPPESEWLRLTRHGLRPLVVRSSSVAEDGAEHSMAGLFTSVLGVRGWENFRTAVAEVRASALNASATTAGSGLDGPLALTGVPEDMPGALVPRAAANMAVLVQPFLRAAWGGVLFTADPVSGRRDRMVLTAVQGGPAAVVGGIDAGWTATITRGARVRRVLTAEGEELPKQLRRRIVRMAVRAEAVFGGPLDIEWAIDTGGRPILLQARPITALHGPGEGPILGPGPLAETFPDPLAPLEQDLWLTPLDQGLRAALELSGTASPRRLRTPIARPVAGFAVADLQALGVIRRAGPLRWLDPRPAARRLSAAVRVGRLTAALPELSRRVCERVDADLAEVPPLQDLSNDTLLDLLHHTTTALTSLHGYEALAGMLNRDPRPAPTAAAAALTALAEARAAQTPTHRMIEEYPVLLALTPPRIGSDAVTVAEGKIATNPGGGYISPPDGEIANAPDGEISSAANSGIASMAEREMASAADSKNPSAANSEIASATNGEIAGAADSEFPKAVNGGSASAADGEFRRAANGEIAGAADREIASTAGLFGARPPRSSDEAASDYPDRRPSPGLAGVGKRGGGRTSESVGDAGGEPVVSAADAVGPLGQTGSESLRAGFDETGRSDGFSELAVLREALRLRARWVQELGARAAGELGRRLVDRGVVERAGDVALLRLVELRAAVLRWRVPVDLADRRGAEAVSLPTAFRLSAEGVPVATVRSGSAVRQGVGAGGGNGRGIVHMGDRPPLGSVLVVRHLDPRLAAVVPGLGGLVAETGSPLSHLAILAREHKVPTVVGFPEATRRLPDGALVEVDGRTGEVRIVPESEGGL
ncbi:PEP/pyruvate-binding domain-containing protein [Nocardia sp. NPDC127526]|uniref:PEP/pyruvate-binding domain-containing protein n=1 Tax=Nocardia sp. NPDC127526 TaxID=3345393 RepID=UPI00362835A1